MSHIKNQNASASCSSRIQYILTTYLLPRRILPRNFALSRRKVTNSLQMLFCHVSGFTRGANISFNIGERQTSGVRRSLIIAFHCKAPFEAELEMKYSCDCSHYLLAYFELRCIHPLFL
jgi:hypothetical protein